MYISICPYFESISLYISHFMRLDCKPCYIGRIGENAQDTTVNQSSLWVWRKMCEVYLATLEQAYVVNNRKGKFNFIMIEKLT